MYGRNAQKTRSDRPARCLCSSAAASLGGCDTLAKNNYFLPGGVDQQSAVAAQVERRAARAGPMPKFSQIPPVPMDVRPFSAWRAAVTDVIGEKRQVDAAAAGYP